MLYALKGILSSLYVMTVRKCLYAHFSQLSIVSSVRAFYNRIRKLECDGFTVL